MLEYILGNITKEKILLFLYTYETGYAKEISDLFNITLNGVQQQLKRLEEGAVVVSRLQGKTRVYQFNPRYPFLKELKGLLEKAFLFLPSKEVERYYKKRTRPRRAGKPL